MIDITTKEEKKEAGVGLVYIFSFWAIMKWIHPSFFDLYIIFVAFGLFRFWWTKSFSWKRLGIMLIYTGGVLLALRWLSQFGWIGYVSGVLILCGIFLWNRRKAIKGAMNRAETAIWGKPLSEFKSGKDIPKLRFVLKKND